MHDFNSKMQNSFLFAISSEWRKFIEGKDISSDIVNKYIYDSWERSRAFDVDPYTIGNEFMLSEHDAESQNLDIQEMLKSFGNVIFIVKEALKKRNMNIQLFDSARKSIQIIDFSVAGQGSVPPGNGQEGQSPEFILGNASECALGTNAPCLAMTLDRPVQVVGAEHYNYYFHNYYCSAAPVHGAGGEVVGALNIVSRIHSGAMDTLSLAICLADIYDNRKMMENVVGEINVQEDALKNIIEYLPYGAVYTDNECFPIIFNKKVLELLGISDGSQAVEDLSLRLQDLNCLDLGNDVKKQEVLLPVHDRKKSFLLSSKRITGDPSDLDKRMIFLEDTLSVMRSMNRSKGNEAIYTFQDILGSAPELVAAKKMAEKVASYRSSVLIQGESGTGKELFAQAIHNAGSRHSEPFVAINCSAIPAELIESELFGYEPGAFTGALKSGKIGKLELASGGTLFLDEVESMPLNAQIKLLRVLSSHKISKIGGREDIDIDVRVISATKVDLLKEADRGIFRDDLYYRISTITINLPPLRERTGDMRDLVRHFVNKYSKEFDIPEVEVSEEFLRALTFYHWRGNVRELSNVLERALILFGSSQCLSLGLEHLPDRLLRAYHYKELEREIESSEFETEELKSPSSALKMAEEIAIKSVLKRVKGNMTQASKELGISKPTLYAKINHNPKLRSIKRSM